MSRGILLPKLLYVVLNKAFITPNLRNCYGQRNIILDVIFF